MTMVPTEPKITPLIPTFIPTPTQDVFISENYELVPTTLNHPGVWSFFDPKNSSLPELIIPDGESYKLTQDWEIGAITYLYVWGGIGGTVVNYQTARLENGTYVLSGTKISTDLIQNFIDSVHNLHPSSSQFSTITHTDDYPHWSIELVGTDGNRIQLFSDSNTEHAVPWNIMYNGRIYTTWNTDILPMATQIFDTEFGVPAASFYPGTPEDNFPLTAIGIPSQMTQGFSGLLPISNRFNYTFDATTKTIEGSIDNQYPIIAFGSKISGNVVDLEKVLINIDNEAVQCQVVYDTERNTLDVLIYGQSNRQLWHFTCLLDKYSETNYQRLPITMTFSTDKAEQIITRGELYGTRDNYSERVFVPLPDNLRAILATNPTIEDLMSDHIVQLDEFMGDVDLTHDVLVDGLLGKVSLFGQIKFGEKIIRYEISTPVSVEHGKVIDWGLDREKLNWYLGTLLQSQFIQRILSTEPDPILNLVYAEVVTAKPDLPYNEGGLSPNFSYKLPACPLLYSGGEYPSNAKPLQGFGFSNTKNSNLIQFLLLDEKIIPVSLFLSPHIMQSDLLDILTPVELKITNHPPIGRIDAVNNEYRFPDKTAIWVKWDPDVLTSDDIQAYRDKIEASTFPFVQLGDDKGYKLLDAVFWILDDGSMGIKMCK